MAIAAQYSFAELLRLIRAGDQDAATEMVRVYEPAIRRVVHFRLQETPAGSSLESMDICQSVLASFFVRAATGQYELDSPEQLRKLLLAMARKKMLFHQRKQLAQRRDRRLHSALPDDGLAAPGPTPSKQLEVKELLSQVNQRLTAEERQVLELRNEGLDWKEVAARLGGNPEALRKQLTRAIDRVAHDMDLDDWSHE